MDDNPEGNYRQDNEPSGCLQTCSRNHEKHAKHVSHGLKRPGNLTMFTYYGWESAK